MFQTAEINVSKVPEGRYKPFSCSSISAPKGKSLDHLLVCPLMIFFLAELGRRYFDTCSWRGTKFYALLKVRNRDEFVILSSVCLNLPCHSYYVDKLRSAKFFYKSIELIKGIPTGVILTV